MRRNKNIRIDGNKLIIGRTWGYRMTVERVGDNAMYVKLDQDKPLFLSMRDAKDVAEFIKNTAERALEEQRLRKETLKDYDIPRRKETARR